MIAFNIFLCDPGRQVGCRVQRDPVLYTKMQVHRLRIVGMRSGTSACMSTVACVLRDQLPFYTGFASTLYLHLRVMLLLLYMLCQITSRQLDRSTMLLDGGRLLHLRVRWG